MTFPKLPSSTDAAKQQLRAEADRLYGEALQNPNRRLDALRAHEELGPSMEIGELEIAWEVAKRIRELENEPTNPDAGKR